MEVGRWVLSMSVMGFQKNVDGGWSVGEVIPLTHYDYLSVAIGCNR